MIVINFKNYKYVKSSLELAKKIEKYLPKAIVALSAVDIGYIRYFTKLKIFAQHADNIEGNRATGFVAPEAIKSHGASGTLLNHSEHRIPLKDIKEIVVRCKKIKLKTIVCAATLEEAKKIKKLRPYAIAFEDRKLVGSGRSITQYKAKDVIKFTRLLKGSGIKALCGAGISSVEDVVEAKKLGCNGVLIASAIAKVKKPGRLLKSLRSSK